MYKDKIGLPDTHKFVIDILKIAAMKKGIPGTKMKNGYEVKILNAETKPLKNKKIGKKINSI